MKMRNVVAPALALAVASACEAPRPILDRPCVGGYAGSFPCHEVDLLAYLPAESVGGGDSSSVWGWNDEQGGREVAILGRSTGTSFVDVTDPKRPVFLADLPPPGLGIFGESSWREMTVMGDHAFIVSEAEEHGLVIVDLLQLRALGEKPATLEPTLVYTDGPSDPPPAADLTAAHHPDGLVQVTGQGTSLQTAHTITSNPDTGFVYVFGSNTCNGGPHMIDASDPARPRFAGCVAEAGYTHDGTCVLYRGPDEEHRGREICVLSNGEAFDPAHPRASHLVVVDVTEKDAPRLLARVDYPGAGYAHQGALTEDHRHFLMDDELDEIVHGGRTTTFVWDLSDLDAPVLLGEHEHPYGAIDHNQFVKGRHVFQANYTAGLRIFDLGRVSEAVLEEVAYFDVWPEDNDPEFRGAWNVFPFFESGTVVVSHIDGGMFVLLPRLPAQEPLQ